MKPYLLAFAISIAPAMSILAQPNKEKVALRFTEQAKMDKINQLMALVNPNNGIMDTFFDMIDNLPNQNADSTQTTSPMPNPLAVNKEKIKTIAKEIMKMSMADMASIYAKYYTSEDINGLLSFYITPTGKKLMQLNPKMVKEMMPLIMKGGDSQDNSQIPAPKREKLEKLATYTDAKLPYGNGFTSNNTDNSSLGKPLNNKGDNKIQPPSKFHAYKVSFYNNNLTEEDLDKALDFYKSPSGQKTLKVGSKITTEYLKVFTEKYEPMMLEKVEALFSGSPTHSD